MSNLPTIATVARREYLVRVRTRSFVLGTMILVLAIAAMALLPVITRYIDRTETQKIAVYIAADNIASDPVATLTAILNAPAGQASSDAAARADFSVSRVTDLAGARQDVVDGRLAAVLAIDRAADGELRFTLYSDDPAASRTALLATTSIAIADRLDRLGVDPAHQASLFQPAQLTVSWPDPARTGPGPDATQTGTNYLLGFGLTVLIFMLIVLYGNWIAMSVVEEKTSRVMEVVLNATTPFQLLSGKVLGVGAVALTQYAAILAAGAIALFVEGPVAGAVLGESAAGTALPAGLTLGMLLMVGVFGVLGFLLYGVLYAAAGSLVSRQEDVQAAVMPLAIISTGAYLIAIYASTGLLNIRDGWIAILAFVPFVSPFLVLSRISAGAASAPEIVLAIALLAVAIAAALWIAARIYAAGVLLYGQRPTVRAIWRMARTGM